MPLFREEMGSWGREAHELEGAMVEEEVRRARVLAWAVDCLTDS